MKRLELSLTLVLSLTLMLAAIPPASADSELVVYVTTQHFERGIMIWRSDTGFIWALTNTGRAYGFPSTYYGQLPDNPYYPTDPGYVRAINGFGRLWGNSQYLRDQLGGATTGEGGLNIRVTTVYQTIYLSEIFGETIEISPNGLWRYVDSVTEPPPSETSQITAFSVAPNSVQPGGTVQVSWAAQGAQMVLIEVRDPRAGDAYLVEFHENLPLTGSTPITIPAHLTQGAEITLWTANRVVLTAGSVAYERLAKRTALVATQPVMRNTSYTQAAFQQYENGFMIWRADDGSVIVFGGAVGGPRTHFPENLYGPLPDNPYYNVPPGRTRPINGFGRVWGNFEDVRRMMGWALGPEQAYTLTIETDSLGNIESFTLPDGRIVVFRWQYWSF